MNPQDFKWFFRSQEVEGSFVGADPNLELRGRPGLDLLALLALFPSVISSFFTQNKGGGGGGRAPPLEPPLFRCAVSMDPAKQLWF